MSANSYNATTIVQSSIAEKQESVCNNSRRKYVNKSLTDWPSTGILSYNRNIKMTPSTVRASYDFVAVSAPMFWPKPEILDMFSAKPKAFLERICGIKHMHVPVQSLAIHVHVPDLFVACHGYSRIKLHL